MRNYLLFHNDTNNSQNINNIYLNCKKTYISHKNKLNNLKKNIKDEEDHFKNTLNSINNDFKSYKSNLNNIDLPQQYKNIINNTDSYYLDKINKINYTIYLHKLDSDIFTKILNKIYINLNNHNNKIKNLDKYLYNIDKTHLKTNIYKMILNKKIYDSHLDNILNSILNKKTHKLNLIIKKINNLNTIIKKNQNVINKLQIYKKNIENDLNNNTSPNNIYLLEVMYSNTLNNDTLFKKKLHQYYTELDTITNNIDKNIDTSITNNNKSDISLQINNMIENENKTNIIKLLKKKIFKNTNKIYIKKFKNLINKVKLLKY